MLVVRSFYDTDIKLKFNRLYRLHFKIKWEAAGNIVYSITLHLQLKGLDPKGKVWG